MPTFVPVRDVEAPRLEQDESKLSQHRKWDGFVVAREQREERKVEEGVCKRGWVQGSVGWGVCGAFGSSEKDEGAQIARHVEDPKKKLVRNEKGLWVKPDSRTSSALHQSHSSPEQSYRMKPHERRRQQNDETGDSSRRRRNRRSPSPSMSSSDDDRRYYRPHDASKRDDGRDHRSKRHYHHRHRDNRQREFRRGHNDREERKPSFQAADAGRDCEEEDRSFLKPQIRDSPETEQAALDFQFSASQVVDRLLEIFNSDAPGPARRIALADCFDNIQVATLSGDRGLFIAGDAAIEAIATASERIVRAEPKLRVFFEAGSDTIPTEIQAKTNATLCLDAYAAGETPGLAAVVKGQPAPTIVLWRVEHNKITHAWIAPEKDSFSQDWASVTEDRFLNSKAMNLANTVVAGQLPEGYQYWDFHFNNYADL